MMGNRDAKGGDEQDAFSRYWRKLITWKRGEVRRLKRGFSKRVRKDGRIASGSEAKDA